MLNRYFYQARGNNPEGKILLFHGWKSDQRGYAPLASAYNRLGFDCLTFDLRGHGQSDGSTLFSSRQDYLDDCVKAYDTLDKLSKAEKTYFMGVSYGGYLALCLLGHRPADGVTVLVPANFTRETFGNPFAYIHECDQSIPVLGTQANEGLEGFEGDIQIVEAARDEIVHRNVLAGYLESAPPEKLQYIRLEGEKHGLTSEGWIVYDLLLKGWLLNEEKETGVFAI